jgi:16S rRNA (cytosine1402-N4)-methyltransferase
LNPYSPVSSGEQLDPRFTATMRGQRSTPPGQHLPVLLSEVLAALVPQPGATVVDCTIGWGGHAAELLPRVTPGGRLIGIDVDPENLPKARARLEPIDPSFSLHAGNFAGLQNILGQQGIAAVNVLIADLGMSSMQVDDPERGFSYRRDGPLDMRMDRTRGQSAAEVLARIDEQELCRALRELGDEENAAQIAAAIVASRRQRTLQRTSELAQLIRETTQGGNRWTLHPERGRWNLHPAARTFQALRILVNRELPNLEQLLRVLPSLLAPGGRAALISFHSGEDRLVKAAFRAGLRAGHYAQVSDDPIRAQWAERTSNPRSRSAKLRWARMPPLPV